MYSRCSFSVIAEISTVSVIDSQAIKNPPKRVGLVIVVDMALIPTGIITVSIEVRGHGY